MLVGEEAYMYISSAKRSHLEMLGRRKERWSEWERRGVR